MAFDFTKLVVSIIVFTNLHLMGIHGGVHIDIQPDEYLLTKPEDVHISCRPGGMNNEAQQIVLMQIARKGERPMAQIHQNFKFSYAQEQNSSKPLYEVKGHIDKDVGQSYLNLTLLKTKADWFGEYTCRVYYLDDYGILKQDTVDGNITETKTNFEKMESIIGRLMKKISFLEDKAEVLENKTTFLEIKESSLQDKTASLQKKAASLQNETNFLERKAASLFTSITNGVSVLEQITKKEKTDIIADKASLSSLTERVKTLEKNEREDSTQIKSLAGKESVTETDLAKTNHVLSQEVKDRLADKASVTSVLKKVDSLERESGNQVKTITSLTSQQSAIKNDLLTTNKKLSQEVSDRLHDKAAVTPISKRISILEKKDGDKTKQIQSLKKTDSSLGSKITSIKITNKKQSQGVKTISDNIRNSVSSALSKINSLQTSSGHLSNEINSVVSKESALESRVRVLETKHPSESFSCPYYLEATHGC